jgi:arylsulfatase A-like enzyme
MISYPGKIPANRVSDEIVTTMDVFATLGTLIGAKFANQPKDGLNLWDVWTGVPKAKGREQFYYYSGEELQAIRIGQLKYHFAHDYLEVDGAPGQDGKPANIENMKPKAISESGIQGVASRHGYRVKQQPVAIYDLVKDPGERVNVLAQYPDEAKRFEKLAEDVRADLGDRLKGVKGKGVRLPGRVD